MQSEVRELCGSSDCLLLLEAGAGCDEAVGCVLLHRLQALLYPQAKSIAPRQCCYSKMFTILRQRQ
jgi:hypothetical protein